MPRGCSHAVFEEADQAEKKRRDEKTVERSAPVELVVPAVVVAQPTLAPSTVTTKTVAQPPPKPSKPAFYM